MNIEDDPQAWQRSDIALHEASHVAMAWLCGLGISHARFDEKGAFTTLAGPLRGFHEGVRALVVILAGEMGLNAHWGLPAPLHVTAEDEAHARELADRLSDSPEDAAVLLAWARRAAADLCKTERFQRIAGRLAAVLAEVDELDEPLAAELCSRVDRLLTIGEAL